MLRFYLRNYPIFISLEGVMCTCWVILKLEPKPTQIAEIVPGHDKSNQFFDVEEARAIAGDRTSWLNEKYLDKNINEEWPPRDPELYYNYHKKEALKYRRILDDRSKKRKSEDRQGYFNF